ncbi:CPBP family intramembrane glutamic endopeptidase [Listeria valentina]|uniref:CPBP family intramembrane glutamic endopeptidase n=1 Tax=Listeria valentina TaxID=2705293 RepID=UPI003CCD0A00
MLVNFIWFSMLSNSKLVHIPNLLYLTFLPSPLILFFIEKGYKLIPNKANSFNHYTSHVFLVLYSYPILEEVNFRYFIYLYGTLFNYSSIQYLLIATLTFFLSHLVYQGNSSLIKIIFSFIQTVLFLLTQNIFLCIFIHISFNIFVYLTNNYYKKNHY